MSNLHFGKNGFNNFIKGKGFYVALAICLAGAGFASWAAISGTLNKLTVEDPAALESEGTWSFPATEEARENVSQLPIEQNVQSSSPEKSAVSQPSQEQAITGTEPSDSADAATQQGTQQDLSFALPLSGDILSDYSNGEFVLNTTMNDWRTHNGVDIAADEGTPVKAVLAGEVSKILQSGLWGTIVEIKHANGLVSRYSFFVHILFLCSLPAAYMPLLLI